MNFQTMDVLDMNNFKSPSMHYITSAKPSRRRPPKESFCEFDIIEEHRKAHKEKMKNSELVQKIEDIAKRNAQIEMMYYSNGSKKEISSDKSKHANSEENKSPNRKHVTCASPDQKERKSRSAIRRERRKLLNDEAQTQLTDEILKVAELKLHLEKELKERRSATPTLRKQKRSSKDGRFEKIELSTDKSYNLPSSSICQNCFGQITNPLKQQHSCETTPRKVKRKTRKKRSSLIDQNKISKSADDAKEIKKIITVFENTKSFETDSIASKDISQLKKGRKNKKSDDNKKLFSFFAGKKKRIQLASDIVPMVEVALSPIVLEPVPEVKKVVEVKTESEQVTENSFTLNSTFELKPNIKDKCKEKEKEREKEKEKKKHVKIKKVKKTSEDDSTATEKAKSSRKELSFSNLNLTPIRGIYLDIQPVCATTQTSSLVLLEKAKSRSRSVTPAPTQKNEKPQRNKSCEPLSKTTIALRDINKIAQIEKVPYSFNIDKFKKRTCSLPPPESQYPIIPELMPQEKEKVRSKIVNNNKFRSCKVPSPNHRIVEISSKTFGNEKVSFTVEGCEPPKKLHLDLSSSKIAKMNANLSMQLFNGTELCKSDLTLLNHSPKKNTVMASADSLEVTEVNTIVLMNTEEVRKFASTTSSFQSPRPYKKYKGFIVKKDSPPRRKHRSKKLLPLISSNACWSKTTSDSSTQTIDNFLSEHTAVNYFKQNTKFSPGEKSKDVAVFVDLDASPECDICKRRRKRALNSKISANNIKDEKKPKKPEEPSRTSDAISEVLQNVNFVEYIKKTGSKPKIKQSKSACLVKKDSLKSFHVSSELCVAVRTNEAQNVDNKKCNKKLKDNLSRIPRPQHSRRASPSAPAKEGAKINEIEMDAAIFPQNEFIALEKCLKVILDKISTTLNQNENFQGRTKTAMEQSVREYAKDIKFKCDNNIICNICSEKLHAANQGIGSKYKKLEMKPSQSLDNIFKKRFEPPLLRSVYKNQKGFISSASSMSSISDYFFVPTLRRASNSSSKISFSSSAYSQNRKKTKSKNTIKKKKSKNVAAELKRLIKNESSTISRVVILSVSSASTFYSPSSYLNKMKKQLIVEDAVVDNTIVNKESVFRVYPADKKIISKEPFYMKRKSKTVYSDSLEKLDCPNLCPLTDIFNFSPPAYAYHVYNTEVPNKAKKEEKISAKDREIFEKLIFGNCSSSSVDKVTLSSPSSRDLEEYRNIIYGSNSSREEPKKSEWDFKMDEYRKHIFDESQTQSEGKKLEPDKISEWDLRMREFRKHIFDAIPCEEIGRDFEETQRNASFRDIIDKAMPTFGPINNLDNQKNFEMPTNFGADCDDSKCSFGESDESFCKVEAPKTTFSEVMGGIKKNSTFDLNYFQKKRPDQDERKIKFSPSVIRNDDEKTFTNLDYRSTFATNQLKTRNEKLNLFYNDCSPNSELKPIQVFDEKRNLEKGVDYIKAPSDVKSGHEESKKWISDQYFPSDSLKSIPSMKQTDQSAKNFATLKTSDYDTNIDESESDLRLDYQEKYASFNQTINPNDSNAAIGASKTNFDCFNTSIKNDLSQMTSSSEISLDRYVPGRDIEEKPADAQYKIHPNPYRAVRSNLRNFERYNKRITFPSSLQEYEKINKAHYDSDASSTDQNSARSVNIANKTFNAVPKIANTSIIVNQLARPKSARKEKPPEQSKNTAVNIDLGNFAGAAKCKKLVISYKSREDLESVPTLEEIPTGPDGAESGCTIKDILDENSFENFKRNKPSAVRNFFKRGSYLLDIFRVKNRQKFLEKKSSSDAKIGLSEPFDRSSKTLLWFGSFKKKQVDVECEAVCPNKQNKNEQTCKESCHKDAVKRGHNKRIATDAKPIDKAVCTCERENDWKRCKKLAEKVMKTGSKADVYELRAKREDCECIGKPELELQAIDYEDPDRLTDKEVFDKLLNKYEKHETISKRLSRDDNFFDEQLTSVNRKVETGESTDDIGVFSSQDKIRSPRFTNKPKPLMNRPDCEVNADDIGTCFARGFRPDNLMLSGDACFNLNKQDRIKMSPHMLKNTESTIDFSERETPLDFLLALGFMVDEASNALKDDDIRSRLLAAITEARVWINKITTTQGTLLYLVAYKSRPDTMRYFLQLVEAIINKRITNAIKLDGFLRVLEQVEDGRIQMISILGDDKFEEEENEEKIVKKQLKHLFINVYNIAEKEVKERNQELTNNQVSLLRILVAKYRAGLHPHLELIARYIGQTLLNTEIQLEAAMIFLSRLDTAEVKLKEFENYCGIVCEMDKQNR